MKKILSLALAVVMTSVLLLLGACNNGGSADNTSQETPDTNGQTSVPPESEAVEIRAAWWGDTNRHDLYQQIIDAFIAEYSHVSVIPEPTSWTDYWDKLQTQSAGGNAPDFMGMHPQYASDYIRRDILEPLEPYIENNTISTVGWSESTLATGTLDGINYMMAMGITFSSAFVNEGLIQELGLEVPAFDWSWDDVFEWGEKTREVLDQAGKTDVYPLISDFSNLNSWRYFVRQQGREIYTAEGEIGFTLEDVEKYWVMYSEFRDLGIIPDAAASTEYANATLEDSLFSHDKVLIIRVPVNQYSLYRNTFPDKEVSIIRNPSAGSYGTEVGEFPEGAHFAISAKTSDDKKLAAAQLMNLWINTETGLSIFGLDQGVPGNLDLSSAYEEKIDAFQQEIKIFVETLSDISTGSTFPAAGASEIDATFKLLGDEVYFGQKEPEQAAREFYDQALSIIERSKG